MDNVMLARSLFGSSMAFHIIFATMGVGLPFMIVIAEIAYQVKKDKDYAVMAKRWTKCQAILLGVGIPSGTLVGVMLSLLWPGFMEIVGQVIALPFQVEIWAFFLEALFMSIYVYAADRLPGALRIVSVAFVALGASASAVLITDAHAWMNTPQGFRIENGQIFDVNPWKAALNPSLPTTASHVLISAYMTGAFAVVTVAAAKILNRKRSERERQYHRKGLMLSLIIGGAMSLITALSGHSTAQMLHHYQPEKLAAAEGLFETQAYAPLAIGGVTDKENRTIRGAIEIPWALSVLAGNRFDTVVRGLNDFPEEEWPPLFIHTLFNLMVGIGMLLLAAAAGTILYRLVGKRDYPRWLLQALLLAGPLSLIGIETGWIFSCTGRQPWTIYHIQTTVEAATKSQNLGTLFVLFIGLYVFLLIVTGLVLRYYFNRHPVTPDMLEVRYG
ncbi:cytochrome ubiquinol oxidase subunit I [Paenibacillus sp. DXFW5]|uniref:Cytochrome ubiquinol oxidase subunit I n=1 Tax=Paenibacillus rhizolycopersici TaxID=2780073 RepID=A0ABS2H3R9_9BACL|nr:MULTISPECIES: cytochrome ubiquinol oxidase subunit I [Paenibacillus]MBM6996130.1 cytochrome ubiquinol oxidase subunit I [Paenibacillus rhizolycopersici]GIP47743.1 putative cytochrome bd menaquinol oxidase subunit I [Paenibacillus sp. J53TS2]